MKDRIIDWDRMTYLEATVYKGLVKIEHETFATSMLWGYWWK